MKAGWVVGAMAVAALAAAPVAMAQETKVAIGISGWTGFAPLIARTRMAQQADGIQKFGSVVMLAAPIMMLLSKSPHIMLIQMGCGVLILGSTVLMHMVTLPVEFDASFRRAMPLLKSGNYISPRDMSSARQLLRAAAFTYVAAAAVSLLDVMRWIRVLRI